MPGYMQVRNMQENERLAIGTWVDYYVKELPAILGEYCLNDLSVKCSGDILSGSVIVTTLGGSIHEHIKWDMQE